MCNYLHDGHKPIRKSGKAYKLFELRDGERCTLTYKRREYLVNRDGWIRWRHNFPGDGFAAIPTLKEAKRAIRAWAKLVQFYHPMVLSRIEYDGGMGRQTEHNFIQDNCDMIIIGAFKVTKDIGEVDPCKKRKSLKTL